MNREREINRVRSMKETEESPCPTARSFSESLWVKLFPPDRGENSPFWAEPERIPR